MNTASVDDTAVKQPGGCNCAAVRYLVTRPFLTVYICHCHLCQKRTGSAFSQVAVLPAQGFALRAGQLLCTARLTAHGTKNVSWACAACHSRIYTQREGGPPVINLRAGTLDDASQLRPVAQFWTSSAQPWALLKDDVLSYAEQPTDYAPLLAAWQAIAGGSR
jgi:hypothetical protein